MSNDAAPPDAVVDSADVFRRSWAVYEKFVTHNWMRHREVYDVVRLVASRWDGKFSAADFGCGDGSCTLGALGGLPLVRYVAVDRVRSLLDAIPARIGPATAVELIEGDLGGVVARSPARPVELLLASYSLHHLRAEEKREFLRSARNWIAPRGRLVIVDLLRSAGECRRRYLDRFHRHASRFFRAFAPVEQQLVREHMEACDFPEKLTTLQDLCTSAGWSSPRLAYRDPDRFYAVLTASPG